ncbi:hypothetical protein DY000_02035321 [Brassica cretica]|uniref:Serpin domain-containing protein n=1 Tax=Brassica cretica TaxID=69181 RepID=A0ABQ7DUK9_BRACR|nr:hypothetical protein DY000_02035321 [Brassica cretica]
MDLRKSVGKQNELALRVANHVIATTPPRKPPASCFRQRQSMSSSASSLPITDILADSTASGGPTISAANGVWIDKSLSVETSFKDLIENSYKAAFNLVDFRTKADVVVEEVNEWVKNQTRGLITDLLSFAPPETDLIFANALFFHGRWDEEFNPSLTKDSDFHRLDGTKLRVPFMSAYASYKLRLKVYQGFKVLHLPYRGGGS